MAILRSLSEYYTQLNPDYSENKIRDEEIVASIDAVDKVPREVIDNPNALNDIYDQWNLAFAKQVELTPQLREAVATIQKYEQRLLKNDADKKAVETKLGQIKQKKQALLKTEAKQRTELDQQEQKLKLEQNQILTREKIIMEHVEIAGYPLKLQQERMAENMRRQMRIVVMAKDWDAETRGVETNVPDVELKVSLQEDKLSLNHDFDLIDLQERRKGLLKSQDTRAFLLSIDRSNLIEPSENKVIKQIHDNQTAAYRRDMALLKASKNDYSPEKYDYHQNLINRCHALDLQKTIGDALVARSMCTPETIKKMMKLPPMLGMQGLTEPVSFAQALDLAVPTSNPQKRKEAIDDIISKMNQAGFKTVSEHNPEQVKDPSAWVIRDCTHGSDAGKLEVLSPFFEPSSARENIVTPLKLLHAMPRVSVRGAITPMTLSQMDQRVADQADKPRQLKEYVLNDPAISDQDKKRYSKMTGEQIRDDLIDAAAKSAAAKGNTFDVLRDEMTRANESEIKYYFRGQSFIAADEMSSFMNPTQRAGRTGFTYATPEAAYAMQYSGAVDAIGGASAIAGNKITTKEGEQVSIGFMSVYAASNKTLLLRNFGLEEIRNQAEAKRHKPQSKHLPTPVLPVEKNAKSLTAMSQLEAHMSPQNNPLQARYLLTKDAAVKLDLSDKKWQIICDMYAPDNRKSFNRDMQKYADGYIARLDNLQLQKQTFGRVKTYDKSAEELNSVFNINVKAVKKQSLQERLMQADKEKKAVAQAVRSSITKDRNK